MLLYVKLLCIIVSEQNDIASFVNYSPSETDLKPATLASPVSENLSAKPEPQNLPLASSQPTSITTSTFPISQSNLGIGGRIFASPLAKKLAAEKGVDLSLLSGSGSGPDGRVRAQDVLASSVPQQTIITSKTPYEDIDLTNMRQVIAKRLLVSKQTVPHYYLSIEIDIDELLK